MYRLKLFLTTMGLLAVVLLFGHTCRAVPLGTGFTYQGLLLNDDAPADDEYDLRFRLYDAPVGGAMIGPNVFQNDVVVQDGYFTVVLDFGAVFNGQSRWLEIEVRPGDSIGAFTPLSPRRELTAAPYALYALVAGNALAASNASLLDGLNSTDFLRSNVNDAYTAGTLSFNPATTLNVQGSFLAPSMIDGDDNAFYVDPSSTGNSLRIAGSISMNSGEGIFASNGELVLGGANVIVSLGDSTADSVVVDAGSFDFTSDTTSITFPAASGVTRPMIEMFASGTTNDERMVIAHSPSNLEWGLSYSDAGGDRFHFQQSNAATAALTVDLGTNRIGILNEAPAVPLHVVGDVRASRFVDHDNTSYYLDPANTGTALDIAGSVNMEVGEAIYANGQLTLGGANLVLRLGDSTADQAVLPAKDLFMSDTVNVADGDQNIYFTDGTTTTYNVLKWDDVSAYACGGNIGDLDSVFQWNITDNTNSGWILTNGSDVELAVDDIGAMQIDNTLSQNGACDLAEAFLGPEGLPSGTVVVVDPSQSEAVLPSHLPYQSGIVGVVSRRPGILMGGPTADVYPVWDDLDAVRNAQSRGSAVSAEIEEIQAVLASPSVEELDAGTHAFLLDRLAVLSSDDPVLSQMKQALEDQIDQWSRGNVNVALVGRVPVRVVGVVRIGDYLTSSEIPGVAMAMTHAGPTIGVALADYSGNAEGTVVAVIQPGWYGAALTNTAPTLAARLEALEAENLDLQNRLAALEHLVASGQN